MLDCSSDWKMPRPLYRRNPMASLENLKAGRICCRLFLMPLLALIGSGALAVARETTPAVLSSRIQQLLERPRWDSSFWGIHIVSLKDGATLFSSNARKRFLPASNIKLLIGAAALDLLGSDFRFETPVFGEGSVDAQGRLLGNLVLAGRGDPNLEARTYNVDQEELLPTDVPSFALKIADQLAARNVKSVLGDIIADETWFLHEPLGQSWAIENLPWGYSAPVSSLAAHENSLTVEVLPGENSAGGALLRPYPVGSGLEFVNNVRTVDRKETPWIGIERRPDGQQFTFVGRIPLQHLSLAYRLAIPDPAIFAARLLKSALTVKGIAVVGEPRSRRVLPLDVLDEGKLSLERVQQIRATYSEDRKLASLISLPLAETVKIMLKVSHNLYAEMLLRSLGAHKVGLGSVETGMAALEEFLDRAGIPKEPLSLSDGSGLSRKNLITPESMVRLLQYIDRHPHRAAFVDSLPVSGRDGTLRKRMTKGVAFERILAKTGTIEFVSTLSGYATTQSGETLAFSIMVNNDKAPSREVREALDEICGWMVEHRSEPGNAQVPEKSR